MKEQNLNEKINISEISTVDMGFHKEIKPVESVNSDEKENVNEMTLFKVNEAEIEIFKNEYSSLIVSSLEDLDTIEKVEQGVKDLKKMRLYVDKRHKELKAPHLEKCNFFDGLKNSLRGVIDPIEDHLKGQNKVIKDLREAELKRKEAEEKKILDDRISLLKENGIEFKGDFYEIGNVSVDLSTISKMNDDQYSKLLVKVQSENERIKEIERLEAERIEKENAEIEAERIRLEQQRIEQEKEAERLRVEAEKNRQEIERYKKELEDERLRMQKEAEDFKNQIKEAKINSQKIKFIEIGVNIEYNPLSHSIDLPYVISYKNGLSSELFLVENMPLSEDELKTSLDQSKDMVQRVNMAESKRIESEIEEKLRLEKLKEEEELKEKKRKESEEKKLKKLKESLKPDAESIKTYLDLVISSKCFKLDNEIMQNKLDLFQSGLKQMTDNLNDELDKILN